MTPKPQNSADASLSTIGCHPSESSLLLVGREYDPEKSKSNAVSNKNGICLFGIFKQVIAVSVGILLGCLLAQGFHTNSDASGLRGERGSFQSNHRTGTTTIPKHASLATNSKYSHFRALNFQLYTGGAPMIVEDSRPNPECSGESSFQGKADISDEGEFQCYMGHKNVTRDVNDRLAIMKDAVERAYRASAKESNTLKIFVAPEFFFRGKSGAYTVKRSSHDEPIFNEDDGSCTSEMCQILTGLETIVADERFKDWLFLFGTVIVAEVLPTEDEYDYLFYNFGLLYKGYDPAISGHEAKRFIVPKRYVSTSDFLTEGRSMTGVEQADTMEIFETASSQKMDSAIDQNRVIFPMNKTYDRNLWYKYKEELSSLDYIMIEYGWFQMDGLTLTVEICLDHDLRSALTAYLVDSALPSPTLIPSSLDGRVDYVEIPRHQAQLSLVSSAGMTASAPSLALAHGGSIILQDGLSSALPRMAWEYECFKYEWSFEGGSEVIQRNATLIPTEVVFHYHMHNDFFKVPLYSEEDWTTQLRGVFSSSQYAPMITAFESKPITPIF